MTFYLEISVSYILTIINILVIAEDAHESLAVADAKLGNVIKEKLDLGKSY